MARIFWDTNVFIYLLEDQGPHGERVQAIYERMKQRSHRLFTSVLTLGEMLIKPLRANETELTQKLNRFFSSPVVTIVPFDERAARLYAQIRTDRSIEPPDAIQLACAGATGCHLFITNDLQLLRKSVPGVEFIAGIEHAPL